MWSSVSAVTGMEEKLLPEWSCGSYSLPCISSPVSFTGFHRSGEALGMPFCSLQDKGKTTRAQTEERGTPPKLNQQSLSFPKRQGKKTQFWRKILDSKAVRTVPRASSVYQGQGARDMVQVILWTESAGWSRRSDLKLRGLMGKVCPAVLQGGSRGQSWAALLNQWNSLPDYSGFQCPWWAWDGNGWSCSNPSRHDNTAPGI